MTERSGAVTVKGNPVTLVGTPISVGAPAPDFTALKGDLSPYSLAGTRGHVTIINSMPSLETAVCANQARRFNTEAAGLGSNVKVLAVSMDLPFAQGRFCSTEGIENVITLSDHRDASFGQAFGLLIKELRLLARSVVVVDREGVVRYVELVPEVGQEPDYEAALAAARNLL
jgi:thioredoxin-dependent peroxiredoxin